jgi:hypothetical protein
MSCTHEDRRVSVTRLTHPSTSGRYHCLHGIAERAADVIDAKKLWNANPQFWYWLGQHAESCGLVAGAFWKRLPDQPHIQFAAWESASQRPAWVKRLQAEGKRDSLLHRLGATR